jgi:tetrahydromethanopterin S-methyltransferase subunit G
MEAARTNWTDSRLDDLKGSVAVIDGKVAQLDAKVDAGFARLDGRIDETNNRIDKMNHTMLQGMVALIGIITVLLTAFLTIVVTHF